MFNTYSNHLRIHKSSMILNSFQFESSQTLAQSHNSSSHSSQRVNITTHYKERFFEMMRNTKQQMTYHMPVTTNAPHNYASLQIANVAIPTYFRISLHNCMLHLPLHYIMLSISYNTKKLEWLTSTSPLQNTKKKNVISHTNNQHLTPSQHIIKLAMH